MSDPFRLERARRRLDPPGELLSGRSHVKWGELLYISGGIPPSQLYFSLRHQHGARAQFGIPAIRLLHQSDRTAPRCPSGAFLLPI